MLFTVALSTAAMYVCQRARFVKLDLYQDDVLIGHGSYKEEYEKHGRRVSRFEIDGTDPDGGTLKIIQVKTIDKNAYPIDETETVTDINGRKKSVTVSTVTYNAAGEAVLDVSHNGAKSSRRTIPPPKGFSTADESDLWFFKFFPQPGTKVTSTVFDIESPGGKWRKIETTYVEERWIKVGGHSIEAFEVRDVRDGVPRSVFLDSKDGMPVLMKQGQFRTEMHFEK